MATVLPDPACVVRVGGGRGFIVEHSERKQRLVISAAHCLPYLPEAYAFPDWDRTYKDLLGPLFCEPNVWAECVFVDPIADVAILGTPDTQELYEAASAFDDLVEGPSLLMAHAESGAGWFLSLSGVWTRIDLVVRRWAGLELLEIDPTESGQSGSPILNERGEAVGVVVLGSESAGKSQRCQQTILSRALPAWLAPGHSRVSASESRVSQ